MRLSFRQLALLLGVALSACLSLTPTASTAQTCDVELWYRDADGDGYGADSPTKLSCYKPAGYAIQNGDCNDNDPNIRLAGTYFTDGDRDGYGKPGTGTLNCGGLGWSANGADCDDTSAAYNPSANLTCGTNSCTYNTVPSCLNSTTKNTCTPKTPPAETCDGLDNNCDSSVDNLTQTCGQGACLRTAYCESVCYENQHGAQICNWVAQCDPGAPATETCDNADNDCNGYVDNQPGMLQANSLTQNCNPNVCSVGGRQTCTSGVFSACAGCGGEKSCITARCSEPSGIPCNSACQLTAAMCPEYTTEVCNDCDDTGEGRVDEALSCQPHDL